MITPIEEIKKDIEKRVAELAIIKTLPIKYGLNDNYNRTYLKYAAPAVYAIWEGYVKQAFEIYLRHLTSLKLSPDEASFNLLTHYIDSALPLNQPRLNFDSKRKMVLGLKEKLFVPYVDFGNIIPTESNVSFEVLQKLLERFSLDPIENKYKKRLQKLLNFRNKVAHGDNALIVEPKHIDEFIELVEALMSEIIVIFESALNKEAYKQKP